MKVIRNTFLAIWTLIFIIGIANNCSNYGIDDWIVIIIVALIPYFIIWFTTNNSKKKQTKKSSQSPEVKHNSFLMGNSVNNTMKLVQDNYAHQAVLSANIISQKIPQETLQSMRTSYTSAQAKNDLRILLESVELLGKTENLETFFSRHELAMQKILTLEMAVQTGIISSLPTTQAEISQLHERAEYILFLSYKKELNTINKLKTSSAKIKRIDTFIEYMKSYENQLSIYDGYSAIMNEIIVHRQNLCTENSCEMVDVITSVSNFNTEKSEEILFDNIPKNILNLLWIKDKNCTVFSEPSMIDLSLPISTMNINSNESIGYYPNYQNLTPEQRFCYLSWLEDVSKPVDIGYVFLFYYGLERHLFFGDFENAYTTIKDLQCFHNNASFQSYSADALLIAIAYHKRYDLLDNIDFKNLNPTIVIYFKYNMNIPINSDDLINIRKQVGFNNNRYIKENYEKFSNIMTEILLQKFGTPNFPLTDSDFKLTKKVPIVLANYSLQQRVSFIPDITENKDFSTKVLSLLQETHETYKINKRKEKLS